MTINSAMKNAARGMSVERFRMDVISGNIANANTTSVNGKDPYRRREVVLTGGEDGVEIVSLQEDQTPFPLKYEPNNPNANEKGYVAMSNVEPVSEMVNMISASRAYEANIAAFNSAKSMMSAALEIGRG